MDNTPVNTILATSDYSKFSIMNANREINRPHVEAIKKSIERNGNFTQFSPVLVNERFEIIDGQHRFTALSELGLPVFYVMTEGTGVKQAREMNKLNKGWGMMDWAKTYAAEGWRSYRNFVMLCEEYPTISPSVVVGYAVGAFTDGFLADFRDGSFVFPNQAIAGARERLDMLMEAGEIDVTVTTAPVAKAYLDAMNSRGFNQRRMLKKLREAGEVKKYGPKSDNLRQLEDIYNRNYTAGSRVRFF